MYQEPEAKEQFIPADLAKRDTITSIIALILILAVVYINFNLHLIPSLNAAAIPANNKQIAHIIIKTNLSSALRENHIAPEMGKQLRAIFKWQLNLNRLHPGDSISFSYQTDYSNKGLIISEHILAAKIKTAGKIFKAVHYQDHYYTPDGKNLQPSFLRLPVTNGKITSGFSLARENPILGTVRPHKGIDIAAPYGTPVLATGNGVISFAGRKTGYGNIIRIDNGQGYETVYAHLSHFAKGISKGYAVKKGQTIGYVGSTGLSTGPHVHYEFNINNHPYNPLKVKLPNMIALSGEKLQNFLSFAEQQTAVLQ